MANCNCDNVILTTGGDIRPTADGTAAINIANAAGTDFVTFDTTNRRVGVGTSAPAGRLHVDAGTQANGTDAVRFTKTRSAANSVRYAFEDVGGLTGDGNGGPYWRGLHLAAPPITDPSGGANVFPRLGFFVEYNSLSAPSTRNWVIQPDNDSATSRHQLILRTGAGVNALTLEANGNVRATNEIKVWDSGWFNVTANQPYDFNHNLGALPKGITVYCGNTVNPAPSTPSVANSLFVDTLGTASELGCYIARVTTTSLRVRSRNKVGINEADNGVLTSGAYRVMAWA